MSDGQDRLFAKSRATTTGFQFDEKVVRVFPYPDMNWWYR